MAEGIDKGGKSGMPIYEPDEKFTRTFGKYDGYTLLYIGKGAGSFEYAGRKILFLAPAVFCFSEIDAPRMASCTDCEARAVYFHPSYINSAFTLENMRAGSESFTTTENHDRYWLRAFFERETGYTGMISISHSISKRLSNLMEAFGNELSGKIDGFWPCRSRSYLIELLFLIQQARLLPSAADSQVVKDFSDVVSKIILYLYTNYKNKITIDELTKEFYMNRTTLAKKFTGEVGEPIIAYLVRLRVTLAASMLRDTMIPVAEVMNRVGFVDSAHFNRMFKKQMLCSPAEYRQQYCWIYK